MKDFTELSDRDLVNEIKADNILAFDILFKKYSRLLYKFGFSLLKSKEESENLIQDVFLVLWENRKKIEKDSSIRYYIYTVAHNSAISIIRKKIVESKYLAYNNISQNLIQDSVHSEFELTEMKSILDKIINDLPRRQKEVYLLHKEIGLTYNEISDRLRISVNTTENHMSRAIRKLRERFINYFPI